MACLAVRAEPIAALYAQGKACHVGRSRSSRSRYCRSTETQKARSQSARLLLRDGNSARHRAETVVANVDGQGPSLRPHPAGPLTERPFSGAFFREDLRDALS